MFSAAMFWACSWVTSLLRLPTLWPWTWAPSKELRLFACLCLRVTVVHGELSSFLLWCSSSYNESVSNRFEVVLLSTWISLSKWSWLSQATTVSASCSLLGEGGLAASTSLYRLLGISGRAHDMSGWALEPEPQVLVNNCLLSWRLWAG